MPLRQVHELTFLWFGLPGPLLIFGLRGISLSEYGSEGFRVQLRRLSEYGSVACLVERPTWETRAEQYSDTVLKTIFRRVGAFSSE